MKFGMIHRVMTDALASLGVCALVLGGQFPTWLDVVFLSGLAAAVLGHETWLRHRYFKRLDTVGLVLLIALQVGRLILGADVLSVLIEFAVALQLIRVATRRGAAHDHQIAILAFLHLIAGTVLGGGIGYGLCFVGILIVAPGALALSHLRREVEGNYRQGARDRTGLPVDVPRILRSRRVVGRSFLVTTCLLSLPIFVFTAVLFVAFPRVGLSLLLFHRPNAGRMVGFSDRVDLGSVGLLRSDPTIALRLEIPSEKDLPDPPERRAFHLRGTALDVYDGHAWTQSQKEREPFVTTPSAVILNRRAEFDYNKPFYRIDLQPIDPTVVFLPEDAAAMQVRTIVGINAKPAISLGPEGELRYQPIDDRGLRYDVYLPTEVRTGAKNLSSYDAGRYLQLPSNLSARIPALAAEWAAGATTPLAKAESIQRHLKTAYVYDLNSPSTSKPDPLDDFLFESKRGHCEFYSTAMAVMLRSVGVPTRNVTGFLGGTYNSFGRFYAVRQGDAHSWIEAWIEGRGWETFDPTPAAQVTPQGKLDNAWTTMRDFFEATSQRWDRHVVGYDLTQQVGVARYLSSKWRATGIRLATPRSWLLAIGLGVALWFLLRYAWRRYKLRLPRKARPAGAANRLPGAIAATALYEQLEAAMSAQGIGRAQGTPPLRHAEALATLHHTLAPEVLELTELYLDARFGGRALSSDDQQAYQRRVRAIRALDRQKPPARSERGDEATTQGP